MAKQYQRKNAPASEALPAVPAVPAQVRVALGEIAADLQEGLLALAVGTGLQVMAAMFEADVAALAGPRGKHDAQRVAVRHGSGPGSVTLGGRRVSVTRPRVRAVNGSGNGSGELPVASYELFTGTEVLGRMALERMLAGLSTRRYGLGLEPVGQAVAEQARSTSKSAVSRRFVQATETALAELLARPWTTWTWSRSWWTGCTSESTCAGWRSASTPTGSSTPSRWWKARRKNTTVVRSLLVGLRERGLDVTRPVLVVIDGAKAVAKAVTEVFDAPVIQRCQLHKIRNVRDHLPERLRGPVESWMRTGYHAASALDAQAQLLALARELDKTFPGAAGSLREGLAETLTILRLDVPPTLARTLRSTNAIESMISICREHAKNVTRWQDGSMALRWCAAGMLEAGKQFRRVNGHLHLPALRTALARHVETVGATGQNETTNAA